MIEIIYRDEDIVVCIKPAGVLSTDEPQGLPELLREQLGAQCVRTVHRLDRVVSGLMLLALTPEAATALSAQIADRSFEKKYLAVTHGVPNEPSGTFRDLLARDKAERKTYVTDTPAKGVQEAVLDYETHQTAEDMSLVSITLRTGRTHQIRAQFSSRCLPLVGDRKYSLLEDDCNIALWSQQLGFKHPVSGEALSFTAAPPQVFPWTKFN